MTAVVTSTAGPTLAAVRSKSLCGRIDRSGQWREAIAVVFRLWRTLGICNKSSICCYFLKRNHNRLTATIRPSRAVQPVKLWRAASLGATTVAGYHNRVKSTHDTYGTLVCRSVLILSFIVTIRRWIKLHKITCIWYTPITPALSIPFPVQNTPISGKENRAKPGFDTSQHARGG